MHRKQEKNCIKWQNCIIKVSLSTFLGSTVVPRPVIRTNKDLIGFEDRKQTRLYT